MRNTFETQLYKLDMFEVGATGQATNTSFHRAFRSAISVSQALLGLVICPEAT